TVEVCSSPADTILEKALSQGLIAATRTSIRELVLDYTNITTKSIDRILRSCPQLHSLSIRHCNNIEFVSLVCFVERLANTESLEYSRKLSTLQYFGHPTEAELNETFRGTITWLLPRLRSGLFKFTNNSNFHLDILPNCEGLRKNVSYCSSCGEGRCRQCYNPRESIVKVWCQACQKVELVCESCQQEYSCLDCGHYYCKAQESVTLKSYVCRRCYQHYCTSCVDNIICHSCAKHFCSRCLHNDKAISRCDICQVRMFCSPECAVPNELLACNTCHLVLCEDCSSDNGHPCINNTTTKA
ncbi:hypothetical protein K7432_017906, partial [Basidiobolus ranarum]